MKTKKQITHAVVQLGERLKIYPADNQPTHAVFLKSAWDKWGANAVPLSHHWSLKAAEKAARDGDVIAKLQLNS